MSISPGYRETFRGHVPAWHCDAVEHFTVAYYFERLERATARLLLDLGLNPMSAGAPQHRDFFVRYMSELRVGSVFVIESGIIDVSATKLHLGHRIIDSASGEVCTSIEHWLEGESVAQLTDETRIDWDGANRDAREIPDGANWVVTGTDMVMRGELDESERMQLSGFIHRFSGSGGHLMNQFGWTAKYANENRVGFSTFEFQLEVFDTPKLGTALDLQACIAKVGGSSVHMVHRVLDAMTGKQLAVLHQLGVHLDKDARRPSRIPDHIRQAVLGA